MKTALIALMLSSAAMAQTSWGFQVNYVPPVYQQQHCQQPAYQQPVYQQPYYYQRPVYQAPVYHLIQGSATRVPPAYQPVYQQPSYYYQQQQWGGGNCHPGRGWGHYKKRRCR